MIYTKMINLAIQISYDAHKNQYDKNGIPYIFHPYHLAEQMETEDEIIVALLHDVIEDTTITIEQLKALDFSENILTAVKLLTRTHSEDYFQYILRIKSNLLATKVKIADLIHNSDTSRLKGMSPKDLERLEKYKKSLELLTS